MKGVCYWLAEINKHNPFVLHLLESPHNFNWYHSRFQSPATYYIMQMAIKEAQRASVIAFPLTNHRHFSGNNTFVTLRSSQDVQSIPLEGAVPRSLDSFNGPPQPLFRSNKQCVPILYADRYYHKIGIYISTTLWSSRWKIGRNCVCAPASLHRDYFTDGAQRNSEFDEVIEIG